MGFTLRIPCFKPAKTLEKTGAIDWSGAAPANAGARGQRSAKIGAKKAIGNNCAPREEGATSRDSEDLSEVCLLSNNVQMIRGN